MLNSISKVLETYYNEHRISLDKSYPGLKLARLIYEFCFYYEVRSDEIFFETYQSFFKQLENKVPLEYITKNAFFYKSNFYVDHRVLIPRSETEILVEDAISYLIKQKEQSLSVAEVGVGSMNISLSILMEVDKKLTLWASEIDDKAMQVAKINYERLKNKIHPQTTFSLNKVDRLTKAPIELDLIVSNPPYIRRKKDVQGVHQQAHEFEPHRALYLDDDLFLAWYEELFSSASLKLKAGSLFLMEGHEDSLEHLAIMAKSFFTSITIKNDYTGSMRFLHAVK